MTGVRRATAVAGIAVFATTIATVALYFAPSGAPSLENVLTRSFLGLFTFGSFIVFIAGLDELVRSDDAGVAFALSVGRAAGLLFIGVGLVALANEAGVVFDAPDGAMDPTIDGPLAAANILLHGSVKRLLTAVYLVSISHAVRRSGILPRWIASLGFVIAAVNVAFIPALFFGTNVTHFYSAHGWGNSALTGSLVIWWVLFVSISLLRSARDVPARSESRPSTRPSLG